MTDILTSLIASLTPDDIGAVVLALAGLAVAVLAMIEKRWPGTLPPRVKDTVLAITGKITGAFKKKQPDTPPDKPLTAGDIAAKKNGKDFNRGI